MQYGTSKHGITEQPPPDKTYSTWQHEGQWHNNLAPALHDSGFTGTNDPLLCICCIYIHMHRHTKLTYHTQKKTGWTGFLLASFKQLVYGEADTSTCVSCLEQEAQAGQPRADTHSTLHSKDEATGVWCCWRVYITEASALHAGSMICQCASNRHSAVSLFLSRSLTNVPSEIHVSEVESVGEAIELLEEVDCGDDSMLQA